MKKYNRLWRGFFAISFIAIAIQQLICADFRPVMLPPLYPSWLHARLVFMWIFSLGVIVACIAILFEVKARQVALWLGGVLLLFVLFFHIPYELNNYPTQLGVWTDPFKDLTLSGGAFLVAGSLPAENNSSVLIKVLAKLIPAGKYFFAATMLAFGIDHFLYTNFVVTLVPAYMPGPLFWTYFAGVALILSGLGIMLNVTRRFAAILCGLMIFIWFVMLHIPRAIADPHSGNGNEWTSVFEALAFSGIAFLIASESKNKKQA